MLKKFFIDKYKELLAVLAEKGIKIAENIEGEEKVKKEAAVNYILEMLPLSPFVRPLIYYFLKEAIDEIIEQTLCKLKQKYGA